MSLDLWHAEGGRRNPASTTAGGAPYVRAAAACMNFLQTVRISLESDVLAEIQERAYTSPIWYQPE